MSLVIPAGQLTRTIITVRCDSPHTAPHIECALDEQTPFKQRPLLEAKAPFGFSTDERLHSSTNGLPPSVDNYSTSIPRADLCVERGVDRRFADNAWIPASGTSGSLLTHETFQESPSSQHPFYSMDMPEMIDSGSIGYSSVPIMTNLVSPATTVESPVDVENNVFAFHSDLELMTALDSFMNVHDYSHNWENLMGQPGLSTPGPSSAPQQPAADISEPTSPEMSASSSPSSSGTDSPTTPFNYFLPTSTPTNVGGCTIGLNSTLESSNIRESPGFSLRSSPILPHRMTRTEINAGAMIKPGDSRLLPCPQPGCRRQFKSTSTLSGHMKTHAGKGARFTSATRGLQTREALRVGMHALQQLFLIRALTGEAYLYYGQEQEGKRSLSGLSRG
ncbi:hypothetical protein EW145_g1012 [Phellinidium pouzarii]|uniref:C2H2-type domain-containing protein n=1 Tax=Phellinidium pouzarii TaxID=167371 RepID=A0A4S4LG87_9AGAM|nr:hypothetical protein EW145_g1012 [Phellinidium pouzarii]